MAAIKTDNLVKRYSEVTAVNGVSLEIPEGEVFGLLGPNGAGKTTLISMLATLVSPTSGTALVAGRDIITQALEVRRHIGIVFQEPSVDDLLTARENLYLHSMLYGMPRREISPKIDQMLKLVNLSDRADSFVKTYSGGMRRRLEIARGLIHGPKILFLDEPTLGLDPNQIRAVRQLVKDLGKNHTVLLSSHILPEVEMTCTRVLILHQGRILAADTPENLQKELSEVGQVVAELAAPTEELHAVWEHHPDVVHHAIAAAEGNYLRCALTPRPGVDLRPAIFKLAVEKGWPLRELTRSRQTLEDIFVRVTLANKEEET